jgi:hypothetical protein
MSVSCKAAKLGDHILSLLPSDGTPVSNRIMRAMLTRQLGKPIQPEEYFAAITELAANKAIGRSRGRGGALFLAASLPLTPTTPSPAPVNDRLSESELMHPTKIYLERVFVPALDLPPGSATFVSDTSNSGPRQGEWARPDFVVVTVMQFDLVPGSQLDVYSFELKTESGGSVQAIHEALAQTRFTHFGHLIWHVPRGSQVEVSLPEIEAHCDRHGIGLIIFREPNDLLSWELLLDARQKDTSAATIDAFLHSRLQPVQIAKVREAVHGERS